MHAGFIRLTTMMLMLLVGLSGAVQTSSAAVDRISGDEAAVADPRCTSRPRPGLAVRGAGPGRLQVIVTSGVGAPRSLRFTAPPGLLVEVGGRAEIGGFTYTPSPGARQVSFLVHRPGQGAVALPLVVTDDCGPWPTVVRGTPTPTPPIWKPSAQTSWQWQITEGPVDQSVQAEVYDIDLFDNDARVVAALHARGRKVICYLNVGAWEDFRPDAARFPAAVLGKVYGGFPDERWLDIRRLDVLGPIMRNRLDQCRAKGFDGVERDNIDGYTNDTGFSLTPRDQLAYNLWLASEAHARGLSIGLKNDPDQVADLLPYFDWALTESCFAEGWCHQVLPFIRAGKAVFATEYTDTGITRERFCPRANALNINAILKDRDLDARRQVCR